MAEMRKDPIVGRWVMIDTNHLQQPADYQVQDNTPHRAHLCPFCPGKEQMTPTEISAVRPVDSKPNTSGWQVRTVPNKFPALITDGGLCKEGVGIYDYMSGIGAHEVIIETPDHDRQLADLNKNELMAVVQQYQERYRALSKDSRFKYVLIFKNFGASAGATLEHAHAQAIALPMVPKYVLEEIRGGEDYHHVHGRCVFCDILKQEFADKDRIVLEGQETIAISPFAPRYPFETWILPKTHGADFALADEKTLACFALTLGDVLKRLKKTLSNPSFNFYLHTAPISYLRQECYHWHLEIIPRLTSSAGFEWGTGLHVVPTYPHDAAKWLKQAA